MWLDMIEKRNLTSHTYNEETAQAIVRAIADDYFDAFVALRTRLETLIAHETKMTASERVRACYQHAVIKYLEGEKMKNATLCKRFGIDKKNAAQATTVINKALRSGMIKVADPEHPRADYEPIWA